ncbi:uncharacterized protein LOC118203881 [Stegodyphus dumicola]|uniref:uncharacterized protein LOC118203881 n=1 Tax=Stegodyphus dumicola TaxID=202533 RepID=UPI0015AD75C4|nr:uncharacterized protein LOC118203881 [Stegodyphus dumicola]
MRFALGKHGYNYLRSTGYPAPSYSTLNRRIREIKINFGILENLFFFLKTKVHSLDALDRNCCLLVDEMEIASYQDFDTSSKSFIGNVTLGKPAVAKHYTIVMLRGLKTSWKQIVANELTGPSTSGSDMKDLIHRTVVAATEIGLTVRASVSDMGSNNRAMWSSLDVSVSRTDRKTNYNIGGPDVFIHSIADVPHLIKNMRNAFLSSIIILPEEFRQQHALPSRIVSSVYVKRLWSSEIESDAALRSLHHLNRVHLFPTHFSSMNGGICCAIVFFWKAWKPFQTGIIMSTLSVVKLSKELFSEGFTFFLPGRLTQDALENAFSQIRRKSGAKPTALQAKRALKLVCLSQFISDINNPNYCSESDHSLFDASELEVAIRKEVLHPISNSVVPSTSSAVAV